MILVINMCKEKLSYDEFVKPITNLLEDYEVKHYSEVKRVKKYESTLGSLEEKVEEESQKDKEIKPGEQLTLF